MANVGKKFINPKALCQRVKYLNHETIASNSWICLAGDVARIRGTHGMNITIFHHFGEYVQATPSIFTRTSCGKKYLLKMAGQIPPWPWNYGFPRNLQGTPFRSLKAVDDDDDSYLGPAKKNWNSTEMSHHYTWMVDILWYM